MKYGTRPNLNLKTHTLAQCRCNVGPDHPVETLVVFVLREYTLHAGWARQTDFVVTCIKVSTTDLCVIKIYLYTRIQLYIQDG